MPQYIPKHHTFLYAPVTLILPGLTKNAYNEFSSPFDNLKHLVLKLLVKTYLHLLLICISFND